jgi:hypothetical protein
VLRQPEIQHAKVQRAQDKLHSKLNSGRPGGGCLAPTPRGTSKRVASDSPGLFPCAVHAVVRLN